MNYNAVEIIEHKRDGHALKPGEIAWLIDAFTRGEIPDEQMSAMAMAVYFRGLDDAELSVWTQAMIDSGVRMSFPELTKPLVDKHSTGGVGDKITLPLAPLVAACGAAVPQLSGRGLGHTGGTLDKLEAIPGWRANLSDAEIHEQLASIGAVICAAGVGLAPADKKLYALRDVTGTVPSIELMSSSIMSKKIAEGASGLVLDVKVGDGAFMKNVEQASTLAQRMVALGKAAGVNTVALLTNMNTPLGLKVGNALEVEESIEVLAGGGPADLVELTLALANVMVELAGLDVDPAQVLASGRAMDVWRAMITAQGGDVDAPLPVARFTEVVSAPTDGVLTRLDALGVGVCSWRLGAGRTRKEDPVSFGAGVVIHAKPGDRVRVGEPLLTLHTDDESLFPAGLDALEGCFEIGSATPPLQPMVYARID